MLVSLTINAKVKSRTLMGQIRRAINGAIVNSFRSRCVANLITPDGLGRIPRGQLPVLHILVKLTLRPLW